MVELPTVANFIARASQQCGFERERFLEKNIPQDFDKISVIMFLGDNRAASIMSMLLLKPYVENILKGKYVILCSFPGMGGLFPYVDEFWSVSDGLLVTDLMKNASGFKNTDKRIETFGIQLRRHFTSVITEDDFLTFYNSGLTTAFFDRFKKVDRFLPMIPHWRGGEFEKALAQRGGLGIFIYPTHQGKVWDSGKEVSVGMQRDFWIKLVERFLSIGFVPVVYQNQSSHDLSPHFGEKCFYCSDRSITSVLAAMRSTGCVLDLFSGISRLAITARCPFLVMDERQRYTKSKEFEINDLCVGGMYPYRYIFSFPTMIESGNFSELIDHVISVASKFVPVAAKVELPPASESCDEMPYEVVRQHKARKLGIKFIKVERLVVE
jgi:hypothetical protein